MLTYIETCRLCPHPDNPRKDLGELTELAESIKANGILQNLTVAPYIGEVTGQIIDGVYRVVIGHRRLAAAKLAGLTEVPCVIANMTPKEQVATMLSENMQRSDLTVYEQAQGFQMMIDFGESVANISEKTGFSETTVRRRIKLLELDPYKFKASAERNVTLADYMELEKIEDIALKNKVLESIGTPNFNYELQKAIDKEKREKITTIIVAELEKFATQLKDSNNGLQYVTSYYNSQEYVITVPDDIDTAKYFFTISSYGYITLYKERSQSESNSELSEKEKARRECRAALTEISKRAYQLRRDFVRSISNAQAKKNMNVIIEYTLRVMLDSFFDVDYDEFITFLNIKIEDDEEWSFDSIADYAAAQPERYLLSATYLSMDSSSDHYYDWANSHKDNETLNTVYDYLEKLGYEMSDDERALRDGTHELFIQSVNVYD